MLAGTQFDFASQDDTDSTNSSTSYSWLTSDGTDIESSGSGITFSGGIPTAGSIDSVTFDFDNDGTIDATLTGLGGASLVDLADGVISFLGAAFNASDDTITGSAFDDVLKGVAGDDTIDGGKYHRWG